MFRGGSSSRQRSIISRCRRKGESAWMSAPRPALYAGPPGTRRDARLCGRCRARQLHTKLRADPRVTAIDGLNARELTWQEFRAAAGDHRRCQLYQPEARFAAGSAPGRAGRLGRVACEAAIRSRPLGYFQIRNRQGRILREAALAEVASWVKTQGWHVLGTMDSPIAGGEGNREYLLAAKRGDALRK